MRCFTFRGARFKLILSAIAILALSGCRLVLTTDDKGYIVSASGTMDCRAAECAYNITSETIDTFTAIPAEGYRFVRWKGLCTIEPTEVCDAKVAPLDEEYAAYDGDIGLSAVFERATKPRTWYRDLDGDHYGSDLESVRSEDRPEGFVVSKNDCDDSNADVHPWNSEELDGIDNNCNGKVDEGFERQAYHPDRDGDGFGDPAVTVRERIRPEGYVDNKLDCDDADPNTNPEAEEVIDGYDNDCDGKVDDGQSDEEEGKTLFRDVDGDGFGRDEDYISSPEPVAGYVELDGDCDDNNALIYPGASERFDSVDNDCDGSVDEGFTTRNYYRDVDGDGFGDSSDSKRAVEAPAGYVWRSGDNCVDVANPDQADIDGDGIGNVCDTFTDVDVDGIEDSADNCPTRYNPDQSDSDEDGIGNACDEQDARDRDADQVLNELDNCPDAYNPSQTDVDEDGIGDACDSGDNRDLDSDGLTGEFDNCPEDYNPEQTDSDGDGKGDACDPVHDTPPGDGGGSGCTISEEEQAMLDAVNAFRALPRSCGGRGEYRAAPALSWSCPLENAARGHSIDMATNNFFSHRGSDGSSAGERMTRAGFSWWAAAENIAAGTSLTEVSAAMQGWIGSPDHCANLMQTIFTHMGAAKHSEANSAHGLYWTQVFGQTR